MSILSLFQSPDVTGDTIQTLSLRVPSIAFLEGGSGVVNGNRMQGTGSLGTRATADMEISLLNAVRVCICACTILTFANV